MAQDLKLRLVWTFMLASMIFAFPVLAKSCENSNSGSCAADVGYKVNYTLSVPNPPCKVIRHPNGDMIQTIPKLFSFPTTLGQIPKLPGKQIICRIPDCASNPCKNGWCEETKDGFKCHCSSGFQGEHCDKQFKETSPSPPTIKPKTSPTLTTSDQPETTSQETTTTRPESTETSPSPPTIKPSKTIPTLTTSDQPETTSQETTTTRPVCSNTVEVRFGSSYYYFSSGILSHASALSACEKCGSHLVYINTRQEQVFIENQMGEAGSAQPWIGLKGTSRADIRWLDGSALTYDNTYVHSFRNGGHCFRIMEHRFNYRWRDYYCSWKLKYICEREI